MASKISLAHLVTDHVDTLRDARTSRPMPSDFLVHYGLPLAAGIIAIIRKFQMVDVTQVIAGVGVLGGLSFGLVIFVFQLRLQISSDPRHSDGQILKSLVNQMFYNVSYAVLISVITVGVAVAGAAFNDRGAPLNKWWTGVIIALALHFLITLAMILKRTASAFRRVNS